MILNHSGHFTARITATTHPTPMEAITTPAMTPAIAPALNPPF